MVTQSCQWKNATSENQVETAYHMVMVMDNRWVTIEHAAGIIWISFSSVKWNLSNVFHMSKFWARWFPRMLTPAQKLTKLNISRKHLTDYQRNSENYLRSIVTQDEIWLKLTPRFKVQSKHWKHLRSPPWKTFKQVATVGKVRWDFKVVIMTFNRQ